jgi:ATP-dependent protease ClpP protease subunit
VIGKINIIGHIGDSYVDEKGQFNKGTNLLDVIEQAGSYPDADEYQVTVNSPGGFVEVGDSIYDYLMSLRKKGKKVTTVQTGLIGSIATKIFSAGEVKLVDDRYKFWIHNPFQENVSGDQDALQAAADAVGETEKKLRKFYSEITGITDEGLDGLMKIETGLTADQCIKFKFATGKVNIPVFNAINQKKMSNKTDEKSLKEQLLALLGVKPEAKKGVPVKAAVPANADLNKSLVVNLADNGGSFYVEGETLTEGANAFLLDAEGQPTTEPVADGLYNLNEGGSVTVAAGKIAKVEMPKDPAEEEEQPMDAVAIAAKVKEEVMAELKAELKKEYEGQVLALKKEARLGVAPKPAVMAKKEEVYTVRTIAQVQKERSEKLKTK